MMDTTGWRVGAPNAPKRATMLVVTFVSATSAALAAGAVIRRGVLANKAQRLP
ncbi:MAG TPA: hypothetical protein VES88_13535 [Gemmatimonadaceae bacterium]|nr:hypothetical protein [Gemmatimonadaceae bacterium]